MTPARTMGGHRKGSSDWSVDAGLDGHLCVFVFVAYAAAFEVTVALRLA